MLVPFDTVHLCLECCLLGIHVCDHSSNIADDCGEDEDTGKEVDGDENVLPISNRFRSLADCREDQR